MVIKTVGNDQMITKSLIKLIFWLNQSKISLQLPEQQSFIAKEQHCLS